MEMTNKLDIWLDACAYIHAAAEAPKPPAQKNLAEDIAALSLIRDMFRDGRIEMGIPLNAYIEASQRDSFQKAEAFWAPVKLPIYPSEIGFAGFRITSSNKQYERNVSVWNQKIRPTGNQIKDVHLKDSAHVINSAYFKGIFVTTDYKLLNKARNEGRKSKMLKNVMRPSEFVNLFNQLDI